MSELIDNAFLRDLSSNYTAGSGTLSVSSAAPGTVSSGTFRVRLANAQGTILKVTAGATGTTWTVVAEANDANCTAASNAVLGCEVSAGCINQLFIERGGGGNLFGQPGLVTPLTGNFTWFNQGSGSMTQLGNNGGILLTSSATSGNIVALYQNIPASHYFVQASFIPQEYSDTSTDWGLVIVKDSTHWYYFRAFQTDTIQLQYMTGLGTFTTNRWDITSGVGLGTPYPKQFCLKLRFENDGSHYFLKISWDWGISYTTMSSTIAVGTDFSGELKVGFGMRFGNVNDRLVCYDFSTGAI